MPIRCSVPIRSVSKEEFRKLDYEVMRHAFTCQGELGRSCDEDIYEADMHLRLLADGIEVKREVSLAVEWRTFVKKYRIDLLVGSGAIYELKTAKTLAREHEAQLLNYLFLAKSPRGKLVNFRPARIESRYVNAALSTEERSQFSIDRLCWSPIGPRCAMLAETLTELLSDWGAFLDTRLYDEALIHFLGGENSVMRALPLVREGAELGSQNISLVSDDVAFRLTSVSRDRQLVERDFRRLLALTPLRAIQWINFNRHVTELITLTK